MIVWHIFVLLELKYSNYVRFEESRILLRHSNNIRLRNISYWDVEKGYLGYCHWDAYPQGNLSNTHYKLFGVGYAAAGPLGKLEGRSLPPAAVKNFGCYINLFDKRDNFLFAVPYTQERLDLLKERCQDLVMVSEAEYYEQWKREHVPGDFECLVLRAYGVDI